MTLRISFQNLEKSKVERNFFKCNEREHCLKKTLPRRSLIDLSRSDPSTLEDSDSVIIT